MASNFKTFPFGLMLAALVLASAAPEKARALEETTDPAPPGVEQLIPRGRIPAVFDPAFVSAAEAEISDDAWVLGVSMGGEAKAYSLNLLNSHEIVNDRIAEKNFAAVW